MQRASAASEPVPRPVPTVAVRGQGKENDKEAEDTTPTRRDHHLLFSFGTTGVISPLAALFIRKRGGSLVVTLDVSSDRRGYLGRLQGERRVDPQKKS